MPQTIFCDESGFTGPNLSDKDQPYFVYSSVAIRSEEANELIQKVVTDFRLCSPEIKGADLVKTKRGQKAVSFLLNKCLPKSMSILFHKRYALASKLFEYIFEPAIADKSSIFYQIGFHKFVTMLLFVEMEMKLQPTEELFDNFEFLMKTRDPENLSLFFKAPIAKRRTRSVAKEVLAFANAQRKAITDEIHVIERIGDIGRWILDLTDTALYSLLCHWGGKFDQLEVYCDESKPLLSHLNMSSGLFHVMVGRSDKQYMDVSGTKRLLTFNLSRPITLVNSRTNPGIQVADIIAAVLSYALRHPKEKTANGSFSDFAASSSILCAIAPNVEDADVTKPMGNLNRLVFRELIGRCRRGEPLLDGIEDFIRFPYIRRKRWN